MQYFKNLLSILFAYVPVFMVFAACMMAFGTYRMDLWSIATLVGAALLYEPCKWVSDKLWDGD